jgi:signal transduction histidine kinase
MTASRLRLGMLGVPEDEPPPAPRSRRDWIVDGALFLLAIVAGLATHADAIEQGLEGALHVVDLIGGAALCLALWGRRRWPFGLGLASAPIMAVSSFAVPAGAIILFSVAAYRRWQQALLVAGLQLAALLISHVVRPGDADAAAYVVGPLFIAAIVAWGMVVRGRREARRERVGRTQAEEQLRVEQIRHSERTRIAREMHDVLAHRISLLSLHAGALEFRPEAQPEEIGLLRDGADSDAPQPPQPTLAALPGLLEESRAAGMRLNADVRVADLEAVPDSIGRHALRIVQEALTNARKHAESAAVDLRVDGAPGEGLSIDVHNEAPVVAAGATEIPGSGSGLVGLAERVALSGGHLEHGRDELGDFHLRAWLPWPK